MTADSTPAFDPTRPFRTRDGLEVWDFKRSSHDMFTGFVVGLVSLQHWYPDGRYLFRQPDHPLDLVNLPEAPPAAVEGEGETDAELIEQMLNAWFGADVPQGYRSEPKLHAKNHERMRRVLDVARRAALVPDAEAVPVVWQWRFMTCIEEWSRWLMASSEAEARESAVRSATKTEVRPLYAAPPGAQPVTASPTGEGWYATTGNRPRGAYADHDPAELISYIDVFGSEASELMCQCRDVLIKLTTAPPTTPAPASPAGGEVGEAKIKRCVTVRVSEGYATADDATTPEHGDAETGVSEAVCWVLSGGTGTFVTEDGSIRRGREHAKRFPTKAAAELARKDIKAIDEAVRAHFQPEQCPAALQAAARVRAASPDGEGWRSISTAPRDGSEFLAAQDGEIYQCRWHEEECDGGYAPSKGWYDLVGRSFEQPPHWRPLPPPPSAQPDPTPTPVPSTDATGGTTMDAFSLLKIVDDWATRWIHDRSHQASGSPDFVHGYQRGASHVAIELRKLVIGHMPDFHNRVVAEQSRAALRSDQGGR